MVDTGKFSATMRIDLIPDVPAAPVEDEKAKVVISSAEAAAESLPAPDEAAAAAIHSQFHELLQCLYDAALIADDSGRILDGNMRACDFLRSPAADLHLLTIFEVISGADQALYETLRENVQNERFTLLQAYCVRVDGTVFPAEIAVNRLSFGQRPLCFFIRDITVRHQTEQMLRTEHTAIQNAGSGIAVANLKSELEYVNPAVAALWGYAAPQDLVGRSVGRLLSDENVFNEMLAATMGERQFWTGDATAIRQNGEAFDVQVYAACNRNSDGEAVGTVFSFVDISDRIKAQETAREAEKQRVMLESFGAACHHLGQPSTVLMANLGIVQHMLMEDPVDIEQLAPLVNDCLEAVETFGETLHKLNTATEYRTTPYLEHPEGLDAGENRIIEI